MNLGRFLVGSVVGAILAVAPIAALPEKASSTVTEPKRLARAQTIRVELDARYRSLPVPGLAVIEATSTAVVESFALLTPDFLETRYVSAENGIYYAICPVRATCPYPARRAARPAADLASRRLALELALRTFLETSADVVAVSLPTPRFIAFIVERTELASEVDLPALARALRGDPARALSPSLEELVDRVTRSRVFLAAGLEPTRSGRSSWAGIPRWPDPPDG